MLLIQCDKFNATNAMPWMHADKCNVKKAMWWMWMWRILCDSQINEYKLINTMQHTESLWWKP